MEAVNFSYFLQVIADPQYFALAPDDQFAKILTRFKSKA
jgi:hypothetical protein